MNIIYYERQLLPTDSFRVVTACIVSDVGIKGTVFAYVLVVLNENINNIQKYIIHNKKVVTIVCIKYFS